MYKPSFPNNSSSLLIAILMMGIIAFFGIEISSLIIKQMRIERDVIMAGKAYYFAEAAVEQGLYEIKNNLPGYERKQGSKREPLSKNNADGIKIYDYAILSQSPTTPCNFKKIDSNKLEDAKWQSLKLNESISIPLYKINADNKPIDVKKFTVYYYVSRPYGPNHPGSSVGGIGDVIRWKIIGQTTADFKTASISEYLPIEPTTTNPIDETNLKKSDTVFTQFGTDVETAFDNNYTYAKYYYQNAAGQYVFQAQEPIAKFMAKHTNNSLILTNVIDTSKQGEPYNKEEFNTLFFKLSTPKIGNETNENQVCTYSHLEANGYQNDLKQSINVDLKLDNFLPVFDFALYRTTIK